MQVTEQDRTLYSLCQKERLLDIIHKFLIYDANVKKVTRYQQYFAVKKTVDREEFNDGDVSQIAGSGTVKRRFMLFLNGCARI